MFPVLICLLCSLGTCRENFESELKRLSAVGMKVELVKCIDETFETQKESHLNDEPVSSDDIDEADKEALLLQQFEVRFKGEIPKSIVGFELDKTYGTCSRSSRQDMFGIPHF